MMRDKLTRQDAWGQLNRDWDLLIIGGGITGAGIFRMAAQAGLEVLLVEAKDFAYGTSSRSSKLVHGGFRYLYNRQYNVTFESVREREKLLREFHGLVTPLSFTIPNYATYRFPSIMLHAGIIMYDLIAPKWNHQRLSAEEIRGHFPTIRTDGLIKGFRYQDAALDDARLVLREIREGIRSAGTALNCAKAERLLTTADGSVHGVVVSDQSGEGFPSAEVQAKAVVQATGPWSDVLRNQIGAPPRMRKQRGSHLIFPRERFPASEAITLFHPQDRRAMFVIPWEGATIIGTTDIDHEHQLEEKYVEPFASRAEIDYMLDALAFLFPELALSEEDITSTFSGLRPIITSGAENPSKESRAHQIWNEKGLITITGGKLTTYQKMADQTLETAAAAAGLVLNENSLKPTGSPDYLVHNRDLDPQDYAYLCGRYGPDLNSLIQVMKNNDREHIESLPNLWAEVRWAVRSDNIHHLDDLLLRRVRLGVLLPQGGRSALPRVREIVKEELGWDEKKWLKEKKAYLRTWQKYYSPDPG